MRGIVAVVLKFAWVPEFFLGVSGNTGLSSYVVSVLHLISLHFIRCPHLLKEPLSCETKSASCWHDLGDWGLLRIVGPSELCMSKVGIL